MILSAREFTSIAVLLLFCFSSFKANVCLSVDLQLEKKGLIPEDRMLCLTVIINSVVFKLSCFGICFRTLAVILVSELLLFLLLLLLLSSKQTHL